MEISTEDLSLFRSICIRDSDLDQRISQLFVFDLYILLNKYAINPAQVLESVSELESGERKTGVKPSSPFKHQPLKGLWHKHFFSVGFLARNIQIGLGKNGIREIIEDVMRRHESPYFTQEMVAEIAIRTTDEPFEKRYRSGKLTGEWIVYLPRMGKNYYLCIGGHKMSDEEIYERILAHVPADFPEIENWISEAAAI